MIHYLKLQIIFDYEFNNAFESIGQEWPHNIFWFFCICALNNSEKRFVSLRKKAKMEKIA